MKNLGLSANELRQLVEVQSYTTTTGQYGEREKTWSTYATSWAKVEPLSGRKLEIARQLVASATHAVTMRYLSSLSPQNRLKYGTRIFNIGQIIDLNTQGYQHSLLVTEQLTGG